MNQRQEQSRTRDELFITYTLAVLVDLVVINLFNEYWDWVTIDSFTISLAAAILMQVLLKVTLMIEHRVSDRMRKREHKGSRLLHIIVVWVILFGSKFVILDIFNRVFGDRVQFSGPWHGVIAFIVLVVAILLAEFLFGWIYRRLKLTE
jgi:hypothetical protein